MSNTLPANSERALSPEARELSLDDVRRLVRESAEKRAQRGCDAAVFVPLVRTDEGLQVLFEVRASTLKRQPGEVCFPGGSLEDGESAEEAAVRETCEELQVASDQIRMLGDLGLVAGLGDCSVRAFVGELESYGGTFSPCEVSAVKLVPLEWFRDHRPVVYRAMLAARFPGDFPWHLIPGGRAYPFRSQARDTYFYLESEPLIWGFTARVVAELVNVLYGEHLGEEA